MCQAKHHSMTTAEIAAFIRLHVITDNSEFTMSGHDANEDISDGIDLINCTELPSESEPNSNSQVNIGMTGYHLEQAIEDCLNQNPVMGYIITQIGQFSDLDLKQMNQGHFVWQNVYDKSEECTFLVEYSLEFESEETSTPIYSRIAVLKAAGDKFLTRIKQHAIYPDGSLPMFDRLEESNRAPLFYSSIQLNLTKTQIANVKSGTDVDIDIQSRYWMHNSINHTLPAEHEEKHIVAYLNSNAAVDESHFQSITTYYESNQLPDANQYTFGSVCVSDAEGMFYVLDVNESYPSTETQTPNDECFITGLFAPRNEVQSAIDLPEPEEHLTVSRLCNGDVSAVCYYGDDSDMWTPVRAVIEIQLGQGISLTIPAYAE
ncbi:hypothetical protein OH460_07825 [Vibrio sp. Makdt]|uniref:hypothetical protein n=1 Tax=Vibrio sp. Makdt TaxID=2998828 RepID=UPI0022CD4D38|nr:hypothetical protein [Vibrio sp. Makdt]MDA0152205.1 hypothetical protein [Vibrio sp. Makdt]